MRILITERGKREITSLSLSPTNSRISYNKSFVKKNTNSNIKQNNNNKNNNKNNNNNNNNNNKLYNNLSSPYLKLPNIESNKIQNYKLKQNPIVNLIGRLYEESEEKFYNLSPKKEKKQEDSNDKFHRKNLSLYNIINKDVLNNMIHKLKKDQRTREKNSCALTFKFRESLSPNNNLNNLDKLEKKIKKYKIPNNHINFINYIKNKKEINPIILNKITKLDNSEIEKEDKICKIILNKTAYEDFFNEKVKERIKHKDVEYIKEIKEIKNDITEANNLIEKYPFQERFIKIKEKHEDFKLKYWTKRNKSHNRITSGKSKLTASTQI